MTPLMKKAIGVTTLLAALASVVAGREQPSSAAVVEPVARVNTRLETAADIDLSKLAARAGEEVKNDAFAPRSFSSPVVASEAPRRREKPEAPPLPFRYVGKMQDGDKLAVFLANGEESIVASAGQKIGDYRVDSITDEEVRFTYLPMKTKQVLPL